MAQTEVMFPKDSKSPRKESSSVCSSLRARRPFARGPESEMDGAPEVNAPQTSKSLNEAYELLGKQITIGG